MKRNRIAAGALALALGLSAVAPSFADDAKAETKSELKSTELFQEQYKSLLERTNKERNDYVAARAAYDKADAELKAAKETLAKEYKAYEEIINPIAERLEAYNNAIERAKKELELYGNYQAIEEKSTIKVPQITIDKSTGKTVVTYTEKEVKVVSFPGNEWVAKSDDVKTKAQFEVALERYQNAQKDLEDINGTLASAADQLQRVKAAETARDVAQTNFDKAEKELAKHYVNGDIKGTAIWEKSLAEVKAAAEGYNVTIQATDKGIVVVKKDDKKEISAEQLAKLQKSIDKANETLKAVDLLKQFAPNTAKLNTAKLDALVAEQKATIAKAEAIIKGADKKVALISTAFAAEEEEEVTSEDVDALIKELDDNTDAINKEMENLDKQVKDEDEEKPADKKDEDKKDEDKKDEEKPADKKDEDKKDEDKKEDKKVEKTTVVEKSANKAAGSNAKTGIAGVAGVAGVLAAASVAYAASKKNN